MGRKLLRGTGIALIISALLVATIPVGDTHAVVLDDFQMDHDSLDKYEGTAITVSVPNDVKAIGEEAFAGNQTIAQVDTGLNTKTIEHGAFANCPYLYAVTTHDSLEKIGTAAFAGDEKLTSVSIGANVEDMGYGVFAGCNNLSSLTISRNNNHFVVAGAGLYDADGKMLYAYLGGYNATYYRMPNTVTYMSKYCFWGNEKLDSVSLSSYLENIPAYSFSNCKNLKSVNIPYSVTTIDAKAFENCVSLADVSIPASVSYIDPTAFDGCSKLNIIADPGTAAYEFFQNFDKSDVAVTENADSNKLVIPDEPEVKPTTQSEDEDANSGSGVSGRGDGLDYTESPENVIQVGLVDASNDPSNVDYMPKVNPLSAIDGSDVIAKTIVVGGRAVLFLDPNQTIHEGTLINTSGNIQDGDSNQANQSSGVSSRGDGSDYNNEVIYDASKGGYLPKYTEVDGKIASQAFYANQNMDGYQIPTYIKDVGDFAYARSGLKSISIPNGVTHIGYGAFYHCDDLANVDIPASVTEIEGYAFDNTPYLTNFKSNVSGSNFLTVGDGILIAYSGSDAVVNIPEGVKKIGPGAFMNHKEITGICLPASLLEVGEDAFRGCTSLTSVTGGDNVVKICDRAYMNCPISTFYVPASVKEIGLRAIDYSGTEKSNNTKVVVFEGTELPKVTSGKTSRRLSNEDYRQDALYNVLFAIVDPSVDSLEGTVLDSDTLGFSGVIATVDKDNGSDSGSVTVKDSYIFSEDVLAGLPDSLAISGKNYSINDKASIKINDSLNHDTLASATPVTLINNTILDNVTGTLSETEKVGELHIDASEEAKSLITSKYAELFGTDGLPEFAAYDIKLSDASGTVPIERFGNSTLTVNMPIPKGVKGDTYHVVTLDADGQLEEVAAKVDDSDESISFTTNHLSYYGIYATDSGSSRSILKNGRTVRNYKKDASPDTGDMSIPVRYVVAFMLLCAGLFAIVYNGKRLA